MKEVNKGILADTSVWIEFFKSKSETGDRLEALIIENSVWTCGVVIFELIQGVKSEKEKADILRYLSALKYAEMSEKLWTKAGELSEELKQKGANLPMSDILIAVIAIQYDLEILSLDKHFKEIPDVDCTIL